MNCTATLVTLTSKRRPRAQRPKSRPRPVARRAVAWIVVGEGEGGQHVRVYLSVCSGFALLCFASRALPGATRDLAFARRAAPRAEHTSDPRDSPCARAPTHPLQPPRYIRRESATLSDSKLAVHCDTVTARCSPTLPCSGQVQTILAPTLLRSRSTLTRAETLF